MTLHLLVTLLFISTVSCTPLDVISVRDDDDYVRSHRDDTVDGHYNSKFAGSRGADGFRSGLDSRFEDERDANKYAAADDVKSRHLDTSNYAGENYDRHQGGAHADVKTKSNSKRGHHNSGFHNSYHKDESSNNSSYYDDNDEEGGDYLKKTKTGSYGNAKASDEEGEHYDKSLSLRKNYDKQKHKAGRRRQEEAEDNRSYEHEDALEDHDRHDKVRDATRDRSSDGYHQRKHYRPGHSPHRRILYNSFDLPEKSTITIYEDPRVHSDKHYHDRHIDDKLDKIRLRVVPSPWKWSVHDDFKSLYDYDDF